MSDADSRECALCEAKATSQCGACRAIWFCGSQCQRTLWPAHKVLCGAPTTFFQQAPLSAAETARLDQLEGMATPAPALTAQGHPLPIEAPDTPWAEVKPLMRLPPFREPSQPNDLILSSARERHLMLARLRMKALDDFATNEIPTTEIWSDMASYIALTEAYSHVGQEQWQWLSDDLSAVANNDRQFYTVFNAYFRALLVVSVVWSRATSIAGRTDSILRSEWYPLFQLNCERAEKALAAAEVPDTLKELVRDANREQWNIPPRVSSSSRALHP